MPDHRATIIMPIMIRDFKHIIVRKGTPTITEHYAPITKHTRAGNNGKRIKCPHCEHVPPVYHFAWSALSCLNCASFPEKGEWLVDQLDTWRTPR